MNGGASKQSEAFWSDHRRVSISAFWNDPYLRFEITAQSRESVNDLFFLYLALKAVININLCTETDTDYVKWLLLNFPFCQDLLYVFPSFQIQNDEPRLAII